MERSWKPAYDYDALLSKIRFASREAFQQMSIEPAPTTRASSIANPDGPDTRKARIAQRAIEEIKTFLGMTLYLWVVFGLFFLHEFIVLSQYKIDFQFYGLAIVNALVLAKVMLVAEDMHLGDRFKEKPLIFPILYKSVAFSVVFICFHIVEELIVDLVKHKPISESVASVGGGSLRGILGVGVIVAVALIPFFAFREVGRAIGERKLYSLLFVGGR